MKYFILLSIGLVAGITAQQQSGNTQPDSQSIFPPFLANAPDNIKNQYLAVIKDADSKTSKQIEDDLDKLMRTLGGTYLSEHEKLKKAAEEAKANYEKIRQTVVAKLSPAAREADAKMAAIDNNEKLTNRAKAQQIEAIMKSLSAGVRDEIIRAFQNTN
ncbi:unnamed protein product [Cercopithifilaria johnstoni]|uniref:SXP/RAL-2 family protein Ani s 5-like cation-binding domain-containing protein n=1 Tax=Cercopithifilaria johnstoni TaxID=2874296 RepID=A0A8J2MKQ6_9BILA|nr:unnamed protein product [Cercopithifilaria johnstoni]